jgi:hypothetical protein
MSLGQQVFPSAVTGLGDPIAEAREQTRTYLAWSVVGLLVVVVGLIAAWFIFSGSSATDARLSALLTGLFTPLIGVAGTVLGFYFGSGGDRPSK